MTTSDPLDLTPDRLAAELTELGLLAGPPEPEP